MNPMISLKKHDGSFDYLKLFLFSVVAVSFYVSFIDFGFLGHSNLSKFSADFVQSLLKKSPLFNVWLNDFSMYVQSYHVFFWFGCVESGQKVRGKHVNFEDPVLIMVQNAYKAGQL